MRMLRSIVVVVILLPRCLLKQSCQSIQTPVKSVCVETHQPHDRDDGKRQDARKNRAQNGKPACESHKKACRNARIAACSFQKLLVRPETLSLQTAKSLLLFWRELTD